VRSSVQLRFKRPSRRAGTFGALGAYCLGPAFIAILCGVAMQSARVEEVWYGTNNHQPDFLDLFNPDAAWAKAAAGISAIEFASDVALRAPLDQLQKIMANVRQRNLKLVVGLGPLSGPGPHDCGQRVEGYSAPGEPLAVATRLKSVGAQPQYFLMDEPLYYGHVFGRAESGCHTTIHDIARDVASKLRQVRTVFPEVRFGDIEPLTGFSSKTWLSDLESWLDEFEAETGEKLAFFQLDLAWHEPWQDRIPALVRLLRSRGVPLHVIYDGNGNETSDKEAIANTIAHFKEYESSGRSPPDVAVIQYWTPHPSRSLPETDPGTATYVIDRYLSWRRLR
jgi:hypothetical protein